MRGSFVLITSYFCLGFLEGSLQEEWSMALQQEIIQTLHVKPQIDAAQEVRVSVDFLKSYLLAHPFIKSLVLGISGGQDSTLTGKLCQTAISRSEERRVGKECR